MGKIVFGKDMGGFGDLLCCFKALYAIKSLYPQDKLIVYNDKNLDFLRQVGFIDKVIDSSTTDLKALCEMKPDIFITTLRKSAFLKELKKLDFKKIITHPHFISVTSRAFTTPLPYSRGKKYMSEINLTLARAINKKHYDANIAKIDFSKMKDFMPKDTSLSEPFLKTVNFAYKKIIGINAFSSFKQGLGFNFFLNDWLFIAFELGRIFPEFLFIMLNFQKNAIQFNVNETQNVRFFVNNDSWASLVSMSLNFDYFISIDTSNVHLCNILQVPSFVFIDEGMRYRMGGGGCTFAVPYGWQKEYQKTLKAFIDELKEQLQRLL